MSSNRPKISSSPYCSGIGAGAYSGGMIGCRSGCGCGCGCGVKRDGSLSTVRAAAACAAAASTAGGGGGAGVLNVTPPASSGCMSCGGNTGGGVSRVIDRGVVLGALDKRSTACLILASCSDRIALTKVSDTRNCEKKAEYFRSCNMRLRCASNARPDVSLSIIPINSSMTSFWAMAILARRSVASDKLIYKQNNRSKRETQGKQVDQPTKPNSSRHRSGEAKAGIDPRRVHLVQRRTTYHMLVYPTRHAEQRSNDNTASQTAAVNKTPAYVV